jgi:pimeloyl-ACP methyl ester carboxylesterase
MTSEDKEIPDASHWIPLDAPERLNELLLGWLRNSKPQ